MTYAKGTTVTVDKSQMEIAQILARYGVDTYGFGASPGGGLVEFAYKGMPIRLRVPLPVRPDKLEVRNPDTGRMVKTMPKWEQETREAWRALVLFIKAALESVERGIVKVEQAFMAFLVAPDGQTVGDKVLPSYLHAIATNTPLALAGGQS